MGFFIRPACRRGLEATLTHENVHGHENVGPASLRCVATFAVSDRRGVVKVGGSGFCRKVQPVSEEKNHPPGKPVATFISSNLKPLKPSNPVALKNGTLGFPGTSIFGWGSGLFL